MADKPLFRKPTEAEFAESARLARDDRYVRLRALGGRVAALDKLHVQLVDDAQLYASDDLQDQRDAVGHAVLAVVDFLRAQGFGNQTVAPLMRNVSALVERENGSLDLMFAERKRRKGGRPKATITEHERTGILAALVEGWLIIHNEDQRILRLKLAEIARKMKGRWFGDISVSQLKTARDLVKQEARNHPAVQTAQLFYSFFVKTAESFGAEYAFRIMVRWLNDTKVPFGLGEGGISKTPYVSPTAED